MPFKITFTVPFLSNRKSDVARKTIVISRIQFFLVNIFIVGKYIIPRSNILEKEVYYVDFSLKKLFNAISPHKNTFQKINTL